MRRHIFGGSRVNRDRRAAAFDRWVIAEAERRRQASVVPASPEAEEAVEAATCEHCHRATCLGDCPQYYEDLRDEVEERDCED